MTNPRLCTALLACALSAAVSPPAAAQTGKPGASTSATRAQQVAVNRVSESVKVVHTMAASPGIPELLKQARGVYIVPSFGKAALGVGASGGAGVLMVRRADGGWGNPAFFNMGGLSLGVQAGAEGGAVALLLMNQKAVDSFRNKNNFALSADAGFTVVDFARMKRGSTLGDVVAWTATRGLFGNAAAVGFDDIRYSQDVTQAYYGKPVTAMAAIDSTETNTRADALRRVLDNPPAPAGAGAK